MKILSAIDDKKDIVSKEYVDGKTTSLESSITSLQNNKADMVDLDTKADKEHVHKYAGSTTEGGSAISADKLTTPRQIGVTGGAFSKEILFDGTANRWLNIEAVYDFALSWGNKPIVGSLGLIEKSMSAIHSANRFAFPKSGSVKVEYSKDGTTWADYPDSDSIASAVFTDLDTVGFKLGGEATSYSANDKLRITLDGEKMGLYALLRKLIINVSTRGHKGCKVTVETAKNNTPTQFTKKGTYDLIGWSGWNSIPLELVFGGSKGHTNDNYLRLTFSAESFGGSSGAMQVINIMAFSDTIWMIPNAMANNGHLYTYDRDGSARFPNNLTANSCITGQRLRTTADTHLTKKAEKIAILDKNGYIYHRTPSEVLFDINGASSTDLNTTNGTVEILQSDFRDLSQAVTAMSSDIIQNKTDISGIKTDIAISTATINKFKALGFKG